MSSGKLVVFYGTNNLGKTTQAELLVSELKKKGLPAIYVKYPIYDLEPTGPMINNYLREDNKWRLTARELQTLFAFNRVQHKPFLTKILDKRVNVVAEDYWGSTLAWGIAYGIEKEYLQLINQDRIQEDIAFLFDGERFQSGIESRHAHESDEALMLRSRKAHTDLGSELGWIKVAANRSVEDVQAEVWQMVSKIL